MELPTLDKVYIGSKKVLVRAGFDVPQDESGNISDDSRIILSIPTIKYLLEHGAKQIILITHFGRPKNNEKKYQTDVIANRLSELIGIKVHKISGFKNIPSPEESKLVILENLRFDSREKDEDQRKRDEFGKELASLADVYVNDAFSNCHRDHASMTSIPKFIPGCVGLSVENELITINKAMENPNRPFVSIIGGLKADKLNAVENLIDRVDTLIIGGALAFTILKEFGKNVGKSKVDSEGLSDFRHVVEKIRNNRKVLLPIDAVLGKSVDQNSETKIVSIDEIDADWMALDIGPKTVELFKQALLSAKTIVWNGPIGVFEVEKFAQGTKDIAHIISSCDAVTIVGGGDSGNAIENLGLKEKMTLVSSGGGASLELFEGKELVAISALRKL